MKPSYTEQRRNEPRTDRKFRAEDEHLIARDKEDVALSPHGDKLAPRPEQSRPEQQGDGDDAERATAP